MTQGNPPPQSRDMAKGIADAQPVRSEAMFDLYLTSSHPFVTAMADNLAFPYEHYSSRRKQKMRDADRESLKTVLRIIIANLAKASFEGLEPPQIAVHLRAAKQKRTRYDRDGFNGLQKILRPSPPTMGASRWLSLARRALRARSKPMTASRKPWSASPSALSTLSKLRAAKRYR